MGKNNMTFKIGGEAGQGVESSGAGFARALARGGLHVYGLQDYMSRIRGGHNFYQIRVSETPLYTHDESIHLLIALDPETIERHQHEVVRGGGIVYDESFEIDTDGFSKRGAKDFPVPLKQIAEEIGGSDIMVNTAALGASAGITGYDFKHLADVIRDNFRKKGQDVIEVNLSVGRRAYEYAHERYAKGFEYTLASIESPERMVINGNQALSMGALFGGCRFIGAYPMTPASSILEWLTAHGAKYGVVAKHTEDEISALLMTIGASHAGVRAMTATSGGGFCLMVESLGLAAMTETPVVIVESQRPGPATGMPTRTEQGDLQFVLRAAQGEFPRIILAPGTIEECFRAGWRAFNLAERIQSPVIILLDNYLSNSVRSIERREFHFEDIEMDRGEFLSPQQLDTLSEDYRRYALTESGISPRAAPGHPNAVFVACSDEHDEYGNFNDEDPDNRIKMVQKRLRKVETAREALDGPRRYGEEQADTTLIGWGSSYGPMREVVQRLEAQGQSANLLHFSDIWPLPVERIAPLLEQSRRLVTVESNATGQFAQLLNAYAGIQADEAILRFDGRPLSPEYILNRLG
jgi:2-oxoglutarate/2-oxoacid ferredoxin oxidoreductase subunit alpha